MRPIRLILVDDHRVFLETLVMRLGAEPDIEVCAGVSEVARVMQQSVACRADVAVLDLHLPGSDGIDVGRALRCLNPTLALVALTAGEIEARATAAVAAGFSGWVPKEASYEDLVATIRAVHSGETRMPPQLLVRALRHLLASGQLVQEADRRLTYLSSRERQVLDLMSEGLDRQEIGCRLFISPNTVRTHQQHILTKLDVHSSLAAVAVASRVTSPADDRERSQPTSPGDAFPRPRRLGVSPVAAGCEVEGRP